MSDRTQQIQVQLPLPLDVAGTLMKLIGAVYPSARVRPFGSSHMVLEIDLEDRVPDGDVDAYLEGVSPELLSPEAGETVLTNSGVTAPEWLARLAGSIMEIALDAAPNYIEADFTINAGTDLTMIVARTAEQTPHALRMKAEKRVTKLEEKLRDLGVDPESI